MLKKLSELNSNQTGIIKQIDGGDDLKEKLNALGIRENIKITKISESFMQGPIVVRINKMEAALGRGMASKVIVEVDESK